STDTIVCHTLSLHDALPIFQSLNLACRFISADTISAIGQMSTLENLRLSYGQTFNQSHERVPFNEDEGPLPHVQKLYRLTHLTRSEEHTSELQSRENLVCRL